LRDVRQSLRHGVDPRGKSGSRGRCDTDKATAIESHWDSSVRDANALMIASAAVRRMRLMVWSIL